MVQWVNVCNAELYFNGYVEIQSQYHAIHPFKVYNSMFFTFFKMFLQIGANITIINFRTFLSPQRETLCPLSYHLLIPHTHFQP